MPKDKYPTLNSFKNSLNEIKESGIYDFYVKDLAGNISNKFTKEINLNKENKKANLVINILKDENNGLIMASNISNILNNNTYYMNWVRKKDFNFVQEYLAIIDDKGSNIYYKKDDMN